MKKVFIITYGCQMNVYDSVRMKDLLAPFGYEPSDSIEDADIVILNTCHIRENASEKTYSELGRIKKLKDKKFANYGTYMIIVVAGCVAQATGEEIFKRAPYVDIVVGPQSYHTLPELVAKIARKEKHLAELDFVEEEKFDKLPIDLSSQGVSAFVSIQEGCNQFCKYCVVPYTRGAEFSRPIEQVYREVAQLVDKGAVEVTLLGQNVNAYHGKDHRGNDCGLAQLIVYLAKIPKLTRIRYTTSHPNSMTEDLINLHGTEPKLMPFLHLPVQSGSNKILKSMNRKHTRENYLDIINKLRKSCPDIVLSSDFIVGYPGETEEDFRDTLDLVKQVKFGQCYSFKYSMRPGTPAAIMKDQVLEEIKIERLARLQEELSKQQFELNKSCEGRIMPVLFYRDGKYENQLIGKSPYMQSVHVRNAPPSLYGKITSVKISQAMPTSLAAEVI